MSTTLDAQLREAVLGHEQLGLLRQAAHDVLVRLGVLLVADAVADNVEVLRDVLRAEQHVVVPLEHEPVCGVDLQDGRHAEELLTVRVQQQVGRR